MSAAVHGTAPRRMVPVRAALAAILPALLLAACNSPEATRMRSGGRGGDIGNRGAGVEMHEGSRPYWQTPDRLGKDLGMSETRGNLAVPPAPARR